MNLDNVLSSVRIGSNLVLVDDHPESVSTGDLGKIYIKPSVTDIFTQKESKILLFSAPGATGKSALANYIACGKKALLWDLAKERIANHSLSGMLVEALGPDFFSSFTKGLRSGEAVLVIDALDEAEMISGRIALETLLSDLRSIIKDSSSPSVVLFARTETAHFVVDFYSKKSSFLPISQYEISFFERTNARMFTINKIREAGHDTTPTVIECIDKQFVQIERLLRSDPDAVRSFIGYAPVLEALAIAFDETQNTLHLLQEIENTESSTHLFVKIMERLLSREHDKVASGFKKRCEKEFPDFDAWDSVYSFEEQIAILADYVTYGSIDGHSLGRFLPKELQIEYAEMLESFIRDHPFIQHFAGSKKSSVDFTGPAFRDYILARLMVMDGCDIYAKEYFSLKRDEARFPSQLFFDFYCHYSNGKTNAEHFPYLYDAFKAKEVANSISSIQVEEVDNELYCIYCVEHSKNKNSTCFELSMPVPQGVFPIKQANNVYIDIDGDILLGDKDEEAIVSNATFICKRLILGAPLTIINAAKPGQTMIICDSAIETAENINAKIEVRADNRESLKISCPNINDWFKLRSFKFDMDDCSNKDIAVFENAVKTILKHFRKHKKDAPARHWEFIENIIIGGSEIKRDVFNFFVDQSIIFKDDKDLSQYKLNTVLLEQLGINWGMLAQNATPNMERAFVMYSEWQKKHDKVQ